MIPVEAVQAAAKVLFQDSMSDGAGSNVPEIAAACEAVMRKALEAAAPHMLRDAKEDAWTEGCEEGLSYNPGYDDVALAANPYK